MRSNIPIEKLETLPSPAFREILNIVEELQADGFAVANRGLQNARTRLRIKLNKLAKLCTQARKEIPSVSRERVWPMPNDGMTKYGVDEIDNKKAASVKTTRCPSCGNEVEVHGHTKICPQCGSAPFESEDPEKTRSDEPDQAG